MIISASRRTDIPAFYTEWFINRIREGYCTVPNPFNPAQVSRVDLTPKAVDCIVFWTRNPKPLLSYLDELDFRGYRYYFQYTLMNNPPQIDAKVPPVEHAIETFIRLAEKVGKQRVIWRYDPIVFSSITEADFHLRQYERIANELRGSTRRSVISIMDEYPKLTRRLRKMAQEGVTLLRPDLAADAWVGECLRGMTGVAQANGMEIVSCAEELDLRPFGIRPGKCVDDDYIRETFGIQVGSNKDPSQRQACGCVVSKDIGMYNSCLFGCQYCYATSNFDKSRENHQQHNPDSPSLIGWYEENSEV